MSKYVIAGKSDCPFYARAELLADELNLRLPDFSVHKIVIDPSEWDQWLSTTCEEKGWSYNGPSPLIWRELINRGGKGILLGSCNDFLEMAKGYYGITCVKSTEQLLSIANENRETKEFVDTLEQERIMSINPFKITVTNSETQLAYNIFPHFCEGSILDTKQDISLTLCYDIDTDDHDYIHGVKMELEDLAQGQLNEVIVTSDMNCAFQMADFIIVLVPSKELTNKSLSKLRSYGNSINSTAKESTKILFAGENAMICCYLVSKIATNISSENFFALSRYEENKIKALIGKKLEINPGGITNLVIWGSSKEFIVDYENTKAFGYNGAIWAPHLSTFSHSVKEMVYEKDFLDSELPEVLNNSSKVDAATKALSFSAALVSQMKDLLQSSNESSNMFSLGLISKGWYDVPEGVVYSFPVECIEGKINVKLDLEITENTREKIKTSSSALEEYCKTLLESF